MSRVVLDYAPPLSQTRVIPWPEAAVLGAAGIVLPSLCFIVSLNRYLGAPEYQTGRWSDWLTSIPSGRVGWPFAPLLFAAMFAMAMMLIAPHRVALSWILRWALYTGGILAAQYTLVQAIAIADPKAAISWGTLAAIVASAIVTALAAGAFWLVRRLPRIKLAVWIAVSVVVMVAGGLFWRATLMMFLLTVMGVALIAPAISLAAYLRVCVLAGKLAREQGATERRTPVRYVVPLAWLAAYGTAWVIAMLNAVEVYNALPKHPPDC